MNYGIYFDESNKLDQPNGEYSYYGALGTTLSTADAIIQKFEERQIKNELHFVDYTTDNDFEKYFKVLNDVLEQDININMMIVNKEDAKRITGKMNVTLSELRELFYVKIPERLFYGMTRNLKNGEQINIVIDENSEYEKIKLEMKLEEQMNAHSAYRNKGYKVASVEQVSSIDNVLLQLIDVFMGMIVFLLEHQYKQKANVTQLVKSDLIYRFLSNENNLDKFHTKVTLYKWEGMNQEVHKVNLGEYTGKFIVHKTQFDIQEMSRLEKIRLTHPNRETKFYRKAMGYKNQQLRMIQGYLDELKGAGRNSYYIEKK